MIVHISDRERELETDNIRLNEMLKAANEECVALRKDAARYQWLRDKAYSYIWYEYGSMFPRPGLDAAIDKRNQHDHRSTAACKYL